MVVGIIIWCCIGLASFIWGCERLKWVDNWFGSLAASREGITTPLDSAAGYLDFIRILLKGLVITLGAILGGLITAFLVFSELDYRMEAEAPDPEEGW